MLEPQSTALFLLLMATFGAMVVWVVVAKQAVFRLLAACLAFVPAMMFGVAAVNKYYGYYETWGAVFADFTGGGVKVIPPVPGAGPVSTQQFDHLLGSSIDVQQAAQTGADIGLNVTGTAAKITRKVIVYLPAQYFQKQYATYRFPAIELIHGQPGEPQDWLEVLDVQTTLENLVASHLAQPVVLVMPDVNGGRGISLQCLNQVGGPADDTFVAMDVPDYVAARIRVLPPGPAWGIAGYSEGGYCAANLALRHPARYGFAGVMSGYFLPETNRIQLGRVVKRVDPFARNAVLRADNTPLQLVRRLPVGSQVPQFWVGAARGSRSDVLGAANFISLLRRDDPAAQLMITSDGSHNAVAWRSMLPPMLEWMTLRLAGIAAGRTCLGCPPLLGHGVVEPGPAVSATAAPLPGPGQTRGRGSPPAGAGLP